MVIFNRRRVISIENSKGIKYILYACGEILIVSIGIVIALQVNNWNADNKNTKTEIKTLIEISNGLTDDIADAKSNRTLLLLTVKSGERIQSFNGLGCQNKDSLEVFYALLGTYVDYMPRSGPYEVLKSRGLDIISNDSIRLKISSLYDYEYIQIINIEKIANNIINSYNQYLIKHFKEYNFARYASPIDIDELMSDNEFDNLLSLNLTSRKISLRTYSDLISKMESLKDEIEEEIRRLD